MSLRDDELSELIRQKARYYKASESLHADVRARMALLAASHETPAETPKSGRARAMWPSWLALLPSWRPAFGGFAMGVALTVMLSPLLMQWAQTWRQPGDADLVAEHVRSLRAGPLIQVASSDRHTVKPWFQGKIDYAPAVLDLADAGFALSGGRVEQMGRERMAVMVYTHHAHVLNLFVWPTSEALPVQQHQYRGFHVAYWQDGQMRYGLVSDMDEHEVASFQQAWREHRTRP